jgi:hypothetical protein
MTSLQTTNTARLSAPGIERDDFIIDDDGRGYLDNGVEDWDGAEDGEDESDDEDDFDGEDEELRKSESPLPIFWESSS